LKASCETAWDKLKAQDGLLIPGGFGERGFHGKALAAEYARLNNIPIFGICFGFQAMVVEYAKNVLGIQKPTSEEFF
jgi:CTP synthase